MLGLFQAHQYLTGPELAQRLEVTTRTVRRDVERLRALGYPVEAVQGTGGYRLGHGTKLPPLLLEDDEAVAVVLGLREAAQTAVRGVEDAALQALTKLEHILPSHIRHRVDTLTAATVHVGPPVEAVVSVEVLMAVADACRRNERLRFDYSSPHSGTNRRDTEPHQVVCFNRRWYLVAFDLDRANWRIFRIDRLTPCTPRGPRFSPRELPHGDAITYLEHQLSSQTWSYRAIVRLAGSAAELASQIWPGLGALTPDGAAHCLLHVGAPSVHELMWMITTVDTDFEIVEAPPEFEQILQQHIERCQLAMRPKEATDSRMQSSAVEQ